MMTRRSLLFLFGLVPMLLALLVATAFTPAFASGSFLGQFHTITTIASTVPSNGDVNPYGMAVIPHSVGNLTKGNILVSNFNNKANQQGTGTTIVQIAPNGKQSLFAQFSSAQLPGMCPGGVGLTTALVVLKRGWVIVGSLPTSDGTAATAKAGCLIVLNSWGHPVETFSGSSINGPWDMTAFDGGSWAALFVTNVLNGTVGAGGQVINKGTVIRIDLKVPWQGNDKPRRKETSVIGSGFSERTDPAALVIGPTGVGLGSNGTLYVADSLNNRVAAIPNALKRETTAYAGNDVTSNGTLNDPLGLTIAPNGDILTVNGNDGNAVETTPSGTQVAKALLDKTGNPPGGGCLFGLVVVPGGNGLAFVDDCDNTLKLFS